MTSTKKQSFKIEYIRNEKHLLLPNVTSIIIAQNIYDILFQYVVTPEREEKLKLFLSKLEAHIKSKSRSPFSIPYLELEFLEEGLQELKLLNWIEMDVAVCEVLIDGDEEILEATLEMLENYIMFNRVSNTNTIYVYPSNLIRY
ncbi:MAG TPA: hypothetical protein VFC73_05310 [Syntrophomonadaceae bacterium]|nr:hypothetical protein [Syntrophomonadaceae bacterium]